MIMQKEAYRKKLFCVDVLATVERYVCSFVCRNASKLVCLEIETPKVSREAGGYPPTPSVGFGGLGSVTLRVLGRNPSRN